MLRGVTHRCSDPRPRYSWQLHSHRRPSPVSDQPGREGRGTSDLLHWPWVGSDGSVSVILVRVVERVRAVMVVRVVRGGD